jgi:hypothetical protein
MSVELNKENTGQRDQVEGLLTLYDLCMHSAHGAQLVRWNGYFIPAHLSTLSVGVARKTPDCRNRASADFPRKYHKCTCREINSNPRALSKVTSLIALTNSQGLFT